MWRTQLLHRTSSYEQMRRGLTLPTASKYINAGTGYINPFPSTLFTSQGTDYSTHLPISASTQESAQRDVLRVDYFHALRKPRKELEARAARSLRP